MRTILISTAAVLTMGLAACGSSETEETAVDDMAAEPMDEPMQAVAMLMTADGESVGTATAMQEGEGVSVTVEGMNMPAGMHGVHIHEVGTCAPDFSASGGHWNPTDETHGLEEPEGQHAGDMPNLEVGDDGAGTLTYTLEGGATWDGLMDADGSAFIVHAGEDDQSTDPAGDSGDRIACGIFESEADAMDEMAAT